MSVRFLGQRVYLGLAVVLLSAQPLRPTSAAARLGTTLGATLGVGRRTLARWRAWWRELFPLTPLWRAGCARFMLPLAGARLPGELIERIAGPTHEMLMRFLLWLSPVTIRSGRPVVDRSDPSCVGADLAA